MIYWAQLLHFYQPPTQLASMLKRICNESYRPLLRVFEEHPYARATVNFNGVLTEMLMNCGHKDIVNGFRSLAERGQLEFTGSAKYHPCLPLLPKDEIWRQISLNTHTNHRLFGRAYAPKGFFPPEMCYSRDILPSVINAGYQWLILSGVACPAEWPIDVIYKVRHGDRSLPVFFRDDVLSNRIAFKDLEPEGFITHLERWRGERENIYVITAMDAETYGHHIKGWERTFLAEVYDKLEPSPEANDDVKQARVLANQPVAPSGSTQRVAKQIKMVAISELLQFFPRSKTIEPKPSSWSTTAEDIAAGNFYPLWQDKNNEVHRLLWEHLAICIELVDKAMACADNGESQRFAGIARQLLDQAEHSDQMWWASKRPMWDINLIHMGMLLQLRVLLNAYRAINKGGLDEKSKRECYYHMVAARDIRNKLEDQLSA